jgi:hypothetical protein
MTAATDSAEWNVRWVRQEEHMGCIVACIAMVTGQTYAEARAAFAPDRDFAVQGGSPVFDVDWQLAKAGFATARVWKSWHAKPDEPWQPPFVPGHVHVVQVDTHPKAGAHSVVLLPDGTVLDPDTPTPRRISDYRAVETFETVVPIDRANGSA